MYIDARYSKSYRITLAELAAIEARVLGLAARVREVSLETLASFCGPEAVRRALPEPPAFDEPLPANLPPPPDDAADLGRWARSVAELAEARVREGETRGKAEGLREGEARGLREGEARGLREGEAKGEARGLRAAVLDLCEAFGIDTTEVQRSQLEAMGVGELEALRAALKQTRRWPEGGGPG